MELDGKTWLALVSAIVSIAAVFVNFRLWRSANRPVVTAEIKTHGEAGNIAILYDLVVHNCGNRPAVNIHLVALTNSVEKAFTSTISERERNQLLRCFSIEHQIPLLHQGQHVQNCFGSTSVIPNDNVLQCGATIPITIKYNDVDGRVFESAQTLVVKDTTNFAQSGWRERSSKQ